MDINGTPLELASIAQIQGAMFAGQVSAGELVEAYLARIQAFDQAGPTLNAVVAINAAARARAAELDAALAHGGRPPGLLHGIPIVVKDCIETADMPTAFGCEVFADFMPAQDATVVRKLREAGAIILAKTTLPDWATSWFAYSSRSGESKNPYRLDCDPGGSSSGTGVAVAAAYATVGLGTDCGGSVRLPASFCNLVGVRSTPGVTSRAGSSPLVGLQDTVGPMGRSVADVVRVFSVMAGYDPRDSVTFAYAVARAPTSYLSALIPDALVGARIGVVRNAFGDERDPNAASVNQVINAALGELAAGGATLVDVTIPDLGEWLMATSLYLLKSKFDLNEFLAERPHAPMNSLNEIVGSGRYHRKLDLLEGIAAGPDDPASAPDYARAYIAREEFMRLVVNIMAQEQLDALVYPTAQVAPPTRADTDSGLWTTLNFPTNTLIGSQTWMPAITVPAGLTPAGLPVGLEILARPYDEPTMFRIAYGFEQVIGHRVHPQSTPIS